MSRIVPIPRLSKAGMPSRSEGWGGLFKDEQYRLIKERFASIYNEPLRGTLNRPPRVRFAQPPLLTKEGNME